MSSQQGDNYDFERDPEKLELYDQKHRLLEENRTLKMEIESLKGDIKKSERLKTPIKTEQDKNLHHREVIKRWQSKLCPIMTREGHPLKCHAGDDDVPNVCAFWNTQDLICEFANLRYIAFAGRGF